ncbi:hypothetical protein M0R45_010036 [Rubus argutus]|uniref:Uncharacterized protein n=1 Tax=Rubus argutus TaxID=59490 RepID=A0AAW1Y5S2_RUBAR
MADTNYPWNELAWEINRLKKRKRHLRTQSTAQFSQLAALETDKFILEDENMRLKELDYEMQVKIELKDSVNEELRKQIRILKKLTGQTDSESETTSSD